MDKYEYKSKTERMLELMESGAYSRAAAIADEIDWRRVRNAVMLSNVSEIYEKTGEYQKGYDILTLAYQRAEGSRKITAVCADWLLRREMSMRRSIFTMSLCRSRRKTRISTF